MPPQNTNSTLMAILAYLGLLIVIPYVVAKDDPFVSYHLGQGFRLLILDLVYWFVVGPLIGFIPFGSILESLIGLGVFALAIVGVMNAATGKQQPLPLIG